MTSPPYLPLAATACAAAILLCGCGGGDAPAAERIAYSADPSDVASGEAPEGIDEPVQMSSQTCYSEGTENLYGTHPKGWQAEPNGLGRCAWSDPKGSTLEFIYDEDVPSDGVWKSMLGEFQKASVPGNDDYPGYELSELTRNDVSGNPLWHYQYLVGGSTYYDSYNLYRGRWRITYRAESSRFNQYIADQLMNTVSTS